jgi:cytochrome c5
MTFDRSALSVVDAVALDDAAARAKSRRIANALTDSCVNENKRQEHGLATHGVRCERCHLTHTLGSVRARETFAWNHFVAVRATP